MQDLFKYTLDIIRHDKNMTWIEDRRDDFVPLLSSNLQNLFDGKAFIVLCDEEREWFEDYIISKINSSNRPFLLPFYKLRSLYPNFKNVKKENFSYIDDLLNLTFQNGFCYFYIGKGSSNLSFIAKNRYDSFMWLIDENMENSFFMDGKDEFLDIKLLNLFKILDKSISGMFFNEVAL